MLPGLVLIALAAVSWGTTGSVSTVLNARAGMHPLLVGTVRMWVAALFLVALGAAIHGAVTIERGDRWRCVAMGACMAAYQAAYFSAVARSGIAISALVTICSAPLTIAALAAVCLGERLGARMMGALALGVSGTALLIVGPRTLVAVSAGVMGGTLLALGAGLAYALYVVIAKASLAQTAPLPLAATTFSIAAIVLTPVGLATPTPLVQVARGWPWLLYLGFGATGVAYAIYTIGLRRVPASVAGVVSLLEPLTATILGVWLFGEHLGGAGVAGACLLAAAMGLAVSDSSRLRPITPYP
jgi:drug/metabolite transporter, DME family